MECASHARPKVALVCYEEALKLVPGDPVAANNLAMTLLALGRDLDRAHELAADLRKRFPQSPIFADTYGWACYHRGEYQKAVDALAFGVERWPRVAGMRYHYGMALYKAGKAEKAKEELATDFDGAAEAKEALADMAVEGHKVQ